MLGGRDALMRAGEEGGGPCRECVRVLPEFPLLVPLLFFCPFLSLLLLTNQAPMISIKGGTGIVFVLSLISEDICCTRQVFVFILGYYKLRISAVQGKSLYFS